MADIQSNIRVNIDTSEALASIKTLQRQISAFQKQLRASSAANAAQAENLQRSLINDINATGKFAARLQTIKSTTESFTTSLEKNKLSMGEYFKFGASQIRGFRNIFSSEFNTIEKVARERVKTLQTQYIALGRDAGGALKSISVRPLTLDMDSLATRQAIAAQRQQIFNQLLKQGSTNLLNFGKNTQWAGRQLMVGFTIPLSIFGAQAARTFMEIEEQAIRFKRVYGELFTPAEEADAMLQQLRDLGLEFTKYGVSVKETLSLAADAAAMGKTGVDLTAQVAEASRLAVLGSVDNQQALETTISLTNAFGTSAEELADKINFLNAVENQTVVSIEDLTIAIPKAGPVVRQLGGDVEDLAFFLTAMKEGGINASEGANALKSGLASLINPTEKASQMLKNYGINIRQIVESNRGNIQGVVVDFANALDQLDPLNRARAIEQLFGKFQFARLSTLFQNVIAEGTQAGRVLELTNATTAELAELSAKELSRVEESTTFRFKGAVEEFSAALAPIGEEFLKLVTPLIEFGTKVLESFNNMSDGTKRFVTGVVAVLGGIAPVAIMTFGLLANGIANMIKGFTFVRSTILGFGKDTTTLGSQIDYMTQEQLQAASVAASLDQVHMKLTQTFTSEKGAVDSLTAAYNRSVAAGKRLMVAPAPTNIGKATPGFASGGIVRGPGTGTSDSIVARLSKGEAVIPAASVKANPDVVSSLISNNMPGFAKGGVAGKSEFAHIGEFQTMGLSSLAKMLEKIPDQVSTRFMNAVQQGAKIFGDNVSANVYGKLGIRTGFTADGRSINNMLGKQGVGQGEFLADWDKQGLQRWRDSLKYAGVKLDQVEDDLGKLDTEMRQYIQSLDKAQKITDKVVQEAFTAASQKLGPGNRAVSALAPLQNVAGEGRINISQSMAEEYNLPMAPGGGSKGARSLGGMKIRLGGDRFTFYTKQGFEIVRQTTEGIKKGVVDGIKKITRQASPSKEAEQAGKNIGQGAIQGIQEYVDDAKSVGQQIGNAVTSGTGSQSVRRATATGKYDTKTSRYMDANKLMRQEQSREQARQRIANATVNRFTALNGKIQGAAFALSTVAGVASMFGGQIGEAAGVLFGLTGALTALTTVTQLLVTAKMQERAASAISGIIEKTGKGSIFAGGFKQVFKNLGTVVRAALGGFARLIPVIGGAILAFGAIKLLFDLAEEQRKKIEGLGETANLSANNLQKLGEILGVTVTTIDYRLRGINATSQQTQEQKTQTQQLLENEDFATTYQQQINAISNATVEQAERTLQALALQLQASGFDSAAINAVVNALAQKAGRTDLDLKFANVAIDGTQTLASVTDLAKRSSEAYSKEFASGFRTIKSSANSFSDETIEIMTDSLKSQLGETASTYKSIFDSLAAGLDSGALSAEEFSAQIGEAVGYLKSVPGSLTLVKSLAEKMELTDVVSGLTNANDLLLALQAKVAGLDPTPYVNAIVGAASPGAGVEEIKAGNLARETLVRLIQEEAEATAEANKIREQALKDFNMEQAYETSSQAIRNQIDEVKLQDQAYNELITAGFDAAEAIKAVGDANFYEAYANATTDAQRKQLIEDYRELFGVIESSPFYQAQKAGTGGGGGQKSPFQQAVDALKEQREEIGNSISAYSRLRKEGFGVAQAFDAAKDPVIATALATTKVGTDKWRQLVNLINQVNAAARNSKLLDLVIERKASAGLTRAFTEITPLLSKLGLTSEDIKNILGDPDLAQSFIDDLKDGEINSKNILNYINQIPIQKKIDILFNMATPEGMEAAFDEAFSRQMEAFSVQERQIEAEFRAPLKAAQEAVDAAQSQVDVVQEKIEGLQTTIADKQREIELSIDRPISELSQQIAEIERSIELEYTRPIDALQEESSDLANDLTLIDRAAEEINKEFDKQEEALSNLVELNEERLEQDNARLDIAEAIAKGDIAAAARAIRQASQEESRRAREKAAQALQTARERQIASIRSADGRTREEIEQRQFEISQQIFNLEERREAKQESIRDIQDAIYNIEQQRIPALAEIQTLEDQVYAIQQGQLATAENNLRVAQDALDNVNNSRQARLDAIQLEKDAWVDLQTEVINARVQSDGYLTSLTNVKNMVDSIKTAWQNVGTVSANSIASITNTPTPTPAPTSKPSSAEPAVTGPGPKPPYNPGTGNYWSIVGNKWVAKKIPPKPRYSPPLGKYWAFDSNTGKWVARQSASNTPRPVVSGGDSGLIRRAAGGMVPKYMANGGMFRSLGTDTVPAMLTPGEFVVSRYGVNSMGAENLKAINNGTYNSDSVYNYSVNVSVKSDANPDDIARAVMTQIKQIDSQRIRGNRF